MRTSSYEGVNGDYCIMVITPVCGTGNPGSIPGSRPRSQLSSAQARFVREERTKQSTVKTARLSRFHMGCGERAARPALYKLRLEIGSNGIIKMP